VTQKSLRPLFLLEKKPFAFQLFKHDFRRQNEFGQNKGTQRYGNSPFQARKFCPQTLSHNTIYL